MRAISSHANIYKLYFQLFVDVCQRFRVLLHLKYVPSNENIAEAPSHWLFLVQGGVGLSFQRGLDHRLLTATVAEEGIESCCLITRLSRLRILQELMFSRERYRWNITSVFPPFVLVGPLLRYFFDQRQSVSLLPSLSLVSNGIVIGEQYSKLWQQILFFLGGEVIRPYCFSLPAPARNSLLSILDKSPWDSAAIFFCYSSVPS